MNKINEDQDVCVVCGSIELLDDMWVMVRTPKAVANVCDSCHGISERSKKDFSVLVYNNMDGISKRIKGDLLAAFRKVNNVDSRKARLWTNIKSKWKK